MTECDGIVGQWQRGEGWGVLESSATPGGCWVHFSMLLTAEPFRELRVGEPVHFTIEDLGTPIQDGYRYRAIEVWRPNGKVHPDDAAAHRPSGAYSSHLAVTLDDGDVLDFPGRVPER